MTLNGGAIASDCLRFARDPLAIAIKSSGKPTCRCKSGPTSSMHVSGLRHVRFRFGEHSKQVFHDTSKAAALENLPRIASVEDP
jgi:hypothetical protein